jgi:NADH dehydrogenase FAD-containing subunit
MNPRVLIIGCGFGGLEAVRALSTTATCSARVVAEPSGGSTPALHKTP